MRLGLDATPMPGKTAPLLAPGFNLDLDRGVESGSPQVESHDLSGR